MNAEWVQALIGGGLIGIAVSIMLLWNGRVTGISGILYGLIEPVKGDRAWRLNFVVGLVAGGLAFRFFNSDTFTGSLSTEIWTVGVAGVLVGFGTALGSGCTSGHGVCGISRMSLRSIVATMLFVTAGILSVAFLKSTGVLA